MQDGKINSSAYIRLKRLVKNVNKNINEENERQEIGRFIDFVSDNIKIEQNVTVNSWFYKIMNDDNLFHYYRVFVSYILVHFIKAS